MRIVFIGNWVFTEGRATVGATHAFDCITYLHSEVDRIDGYESRIYFTNECFIPKLEKFSPHIVYIFDCISADYTCRPVVNFCHWANVPVVLVSTDIFYVSTILEEPNTAKLSGILSMVRMNSTIKQYRLLFPKKYIGALTFPSLGTYFRDYQMEKQYDIVIYGTTTYHHTPENRPSNSAYLQYLESEYTSKGLQVPYKVQFYPLRNRLVQLLLKHKDKYRIKHIPSPRKQTWIRDIRGESLSKILNQSYLAIATRSIADRCMSKYFEISASNCGLLGDIPTDYRDVFSGWAVEVSMNMTDEEILGVVDTALQDPDRLKQKSQIFGEYIRSNVSVGNKNAIKELLTSAHAII